MDVEVAMLTGDSENVARAVAAELDIDTCFADIVLVQNDPRDVIALLRLSKKSYRKMQENLVWAAGYNVFALPLAAGIPAPLGVLLSPAIGAVLMSASTVLVAINAQLLRRADIAI